jgi:hypothetical protein
MHTIYAVVFIMFIKKEGNTKKGKKECGAKFI